MRDFEMDFDFDFEVGVNCRGTRNFRGDDIYPTLVMGGAQVFTFEREERVKAHCKRIQSALRMQKKARRKKVCMAQN